MQRKSRKNSSIILIFVLVLSLLTPLTGATAAEASDTISVADAIEKGNNGSAATVKGFIVGYVIGQGNVSRADFREDHNFAIADNPKETDISKMALVQLPTKYRGEFGLKSNPNVLDQEVVIVGDLEKYHGGNGLKDVTDVHFANEDPGEPEGPLEIISIAEAHSQATGSAKVQGIVTAKLKNTIHIQDESAAIAVRPTSLDVKLGDEIAVSGDLQDYRGLLQLDSAKLEDKVENKEVPEPVSLTGEELKDHQSQLAVVKNVTITKAENGDGWANYTAEDENGTKFLVRDENGTLGLEADATYDAITGIISQFDEDSQIIPRGAEDIIADASVVQSVYASPDSGTIPSGTKITLSTKTEGAEILYTTDGSDPNENGEAYSDPIAVEKDMTIKTIANKEDLETSKVKTYTYKVYDAEEGIQIHDIQGEAHESPMKGKTVTNVEGIVTYKYDIRGSHYFHIQASEDKYDGNEKTSEGIVIYTGKAEEVEIGDLVSIDGKVDEYNIDGYDDKARTDLPVTQINARDDQGGNIEVKESGVELPTPIKITSSTIPEEIIGENGFDEFNPENYAIDFWESMEGMRVEIEPSKAVAPQQHGDLVVVTNEYETDTINGGIRLTEEGQNAQTIQFKLYPNNDARDFKVKTGDKFTESITGVVNYGFSNYKVYADLDEVSAAFKEGDTQPNTTTIEKDEDKLSIASYNVENFSANTNANETPDAKAKNIARAFVDDMESPDIIGVIEVQDNNGQSQGPDDADASKSYERLIKEIKAKGGPEYDYANIDPEYNKDGGAPHGNIRVGFLYNPDRVSLTEAKHGTATEAVGYKNGKLTLNPGRVDPMNDALKSTRKPLAAQFEFKGESVVVVANHLNSKLGDEAVFGKKQPPVRGSEPQRWELAKILNGFVKDIQKDNPDEHVVVLGDMNDFEFSKTIDILKGNELSEMIEKVPEEKRYSYVFQGNSQVIDHILVTNNLTDKTEIDILHINADFTEMHGRASDHEPVLTQMDLLGKDAEEPADPKKVYDLKNFNTKNLTLQSPSVAVKMAETATVKDGILLKGEYAELEGEGLKATTVTIKPESKGAIVDFKGSEVKKVIVDGKNIKEIRGASKIGTIEYKNGAKPDVIIFSDENGKKIKSLTFVGDHLERAFLARAFKKFRTSTFTA